MMEVEDHEYSFGGIDEEFDGKKPTNDRITSDVQSRGCNGWICMAASDC